MTFKSISSENTINRLPFWIGKGFGAFTDEKKWFYFGKSKKSLALPKFAFGIAARYFAEVNKYRRCFELFSPLISLVKKHVVALTLTFLSFTVIY